MVLQQISSRRATMMACKQPPMGALMAMAPASQALTFCLYLTSTAGAAHAAVGQIGTRHRGRAICNTAQPDQLVLSDVDGMCTATSGCTDGDGLRLTRARLQLLHLRRREHRPRRRLSRPSRAIVAARRAIAHEQHSSR